MAEFNVSSMDPQEVMIVVTLEDGSQVRHPAVRIPLRDEFPIEEVTE